MPHVRDVCGGRRSRGTIQKAGRWKDFKTMLRYCHRDKTQTREAVEKLSLHVNREPVKIVEAVSRRTVISE